MHHVTLATWSRAPLVRPEGRRELVRRLMAGRGEGVVLFSVVDDHAHIVVATDRPEAWAGYTARSLRRWVEADLAPPRVRAVEGRAHLETLVGYLARQPEKHGLAGHPAVWEGGFVPDVLGARRLAGFDAEAWRRWLPRRGTEWVARSVGVRVPRAEGGAYTCERVWAAALAAHAAEPVGRDAATVAARTATAVVCRDVAVRRVAEVMGVSERAVRRLRGQGDEAAVAATRAWLALEEQVR